MHGCKYKKLQHPTHIAIFKSINTLELVIGI